MVQNIKFELLVSSFQNVLLGPSVTLLVSKVTDVQRLSKIKKKIQNYGFDILYFAVSLCATCYKFSKITSQMFIGTLIRTAMSPPIITPQGKSYDTILYKVM